MKKRDLIKRGLVTAALAASIGLTGALTNVANAADKVTLRMSTWLPGAHHLVADTFPVWIKAIEDASGGTLTIKIDPAPIAGPPAQYDLVRDGSADMAYHVTGYTPGPFEILRAVELPFISPNAEIGSQAAWEWYDRNIGFEKEFKDVKVITIMVHGPGLLHSKDKITNLAELKGVKIRVGGGGVRMAEALGASPVAVSAPKAYETIQKGVATGALFPFEAMKGFKLTEVVSHTLEIPGGLYTTPFAVIMNKDKWNGLSDEHKKVLTDVGGITGAKILGHGWDVADSVAREFAAKEGIKVTTISDDELAKWRDKIAFMNDDWIKMANGRGHDGAALLKDLNATVKKISGM